MPEWISIKADHIIKWIRDLPPGYFIGGLLFPILVGLVVNWIWAIIQKKLTLKETFQQEQPAQARSQDIIDANISGNNNVLIGGHHNSFTTSANSPSTETAIKVDDAWNALLAIFSEKYLNRLCNQIKDPKQQEHMRNYNGPTIIAWVKKRFENIPLPSSDPKSKLFIQLQNDALKELNDFINTKDESLFRSRWSSIKENLLPLKY